MKFSSHKIYDMKLHARIEIIPGSLYVIKVPGGWIYEGTHSTFVPYDDEFIFDDEEEE